MIFSPKCLFFQVTFRSVQFSRSVVSDPLQPHESQHARHPCPSPTPGVYSNSCPWSRWCHPAISSSVVPFSSCPQWLVLVKSKEDSPHYQIFPKVVSNDSFFSLAPETNLLMYFLDSSCSWNQFACSTEKCISKHWICDGEDDCEDGLDESDSICGKLFPLCSRPIFRSIVHMLCHFRICRELCFLLC